MKINPLLPSVPYMTRYNQKFYCNLRRVRQKFSYERCDYESEDEKSLS